MQQAIATLVRLISLWPMAVQLAYCLKSFPQARLFSVKPLPIMTFNGTPPPPANCCSFSKVELNLQCRQVSAECLAAVTFYYWKIPRAKDTVAKPWITKFVILFS